MPLYEYQCDACENRFELIQKFSDPPAETCPKCGGQVRKLPSSPAIQFKGTGWYITDYARKGGSDAGRRSEKGGATGGESGESGTADKTTKDSTASTTSTTSTTSESKSTQPKDSGKKGSSSSDK